jgi:hypothetical protein
MRLGRAVKTLIRQAKNKRGGLPWHHNVETQL